MTRHERNDIRKVLAAIDASAADRSVLRTAKLVASLMDANVEAVHVREDDTEGARAAADAASVPYRQLDGPVVKTLIEEAEAAGVVSLVVGSRGRPTGPRPVGSTAIEIITSVGKPVGVVPPESVVGPSAASVFVPLDGTMRTASALRRLVGDACARGLEVVVAHVYDETTMPVFVDHPQYEAQEWLDEFLARYCPSQLARGHLRVGLPGPEIVSLVEANRPDIVFLGWAQDLSTGRAAVVREILARSHVPCLLVPTRSVEPEDETATWT